MISLNEIRKTLRGTIKLGEPVAAYAQLGVGGPADYLLEAFVREDIDAAAAVFSRQEVPCIVLNENILVSDKGFRGAVIVDVRAVQPGKRRCATMFMPLPDGSVEDLIGQAGLDGETRGSAVVMGNCVVNTGGATAADVITLVHHVQEVVRNRFAVVLETRLQPVGFDQNELARVA